MSQATRHDPSVTQFRMSRIQLVNWGAFHGYHALDVHPGGTLLTGPSGTGKSTLLDGTMTVLMDRTMAFNAAAHDEGPRRERTFHTYVRGKVGDRDTDRGKVPMYLREGATWSAIAVTWANAAGASVTGCRVLFMTRAGASNNSALPASHRSHVRRTRPPERQRRSLPQGRGTCSGPRRGGLRR